MLESRPMMPKNNGSAPDHPPLRVGYILKMFPRLSETFILNELLELERQGTDVSVFSLLFPADGRFHGRLANLKLEASYFPRKKAESSWRQIWELPDELRPPIPRWEEAVNFLRRWSIPNDLDLLLRAVAISAEVKARGIQHLHAHFATIATRMAALVNIMTGIPFSFTSHAKDIFRTTVNPDLYTDLVPSFSSVTLGFSDVVGQDLLNVEIGGPGFGVQFVNAVFLVLGSTLNGLFSLTPGLTAWDRVSDFGPAIGSAVVNGPIFTR